MKWTPETADESINEWAKKEISETTDKLEGLIRFLLGVTASSIIALAAISRLQDAFKIDVYFMLSVLVHALSILLLLKALLRNRSDFTSETDLYDEFTSDMEYLRRRCWHWFLLWIVAIVLSGASLYA